MRGSRPRVATDVPPRCDHGGGAHGPARRGGHTTFCIIHSFSCFFMILCIFSWYFLCFLMNKTIILLSCATGNLRQS